MSENQTAAADVQESSLEENTPAVEIIFPHTVQLLRPFDYGKEHVTEVVLLSEPTAGDLADVMNEPKDGNKYIRIISAATGWPDPKIKLMKARDAQAITAILQPFLGGGLGTGN